MGRDFWAVVGRVLVGSWDFLRGLEVLVRGTKRYGRGLGEVCSGWRVVAVHNKRVFAKG